MSEALLLSLIRYLDINYREDRKTSEQMERVIKEMREILDIVRDEKLEEQRSLNYLVSDLVDVAVQALHDFKQGAEIGSILNWIKEIKSRMLKLGDVEAEMEPNMKSSENVEDDVAAVGLEEDVEFLLRRRIIGGEDNLKTVLIKGVLGIENRNLARDIYHHPTVIQHFECRAWVSNSTYFTLKELLIKLIQQVAVEDPQNLHTSSLLENMDNRILRDMLCQCLQDKRYLVVLHDVPEQMHLTSFLYALPREENGSRLLLTSHTTHIDISVEDEDVYQVKPLDSKQSWHLFVKTINSSGKLTGDHKFPMYLEHMGTKMLRKCGGLRSVIKEVGKQLVEKKLLGGKEWVQILESVDFGSSKLLDPFYHKLDPKLELFFMTMSFFKENTILRAEKLKQIWVAGGLVSRYDYVSYLDGLVNGAVIEVEEKSTKYHMNSRLHKVSILKAEEKLGFEILRNNGNNRHSESPRHRRVIIRSRDKFNYSTDQDKNLVSLFFHGGGYLDTSLAYWKSLERRLRVLDLDDFGLKFLPESIGTLMELRYLGLRNNYIKELPQLLGCLKNLEVLDIAQNFMVEVPDIICELRCLRHLYLSDVIFRKPLKIQTLWNLETLTYVSVDNWTYELLGLQELKYLQKLGIEKLDGNSDVSKLFVSLADLKKLKHLILRGYRFRSMPCLDELGFLQSVRTLKLDGLLARLPNNLPPNIESLTLVNSCLDEDPMPLLGELWELKYLKLRNAFTGQQMVILPNGFDRLEVLCIEELWNLRNLQCGKHAMYYLKKLEIHDCPFLDTLSEMIESISYLKKIKMVTTRSIAAKMRNSYLIYQIEVVNINP